MTSRFFRWLPSVGLVVATALVLVLAKQNRDLMARDAKLIKRAFEPYAGQFVPTIATTTIDGREATLGARPDSARQLLLVFTTTCQFCRASLPAWREIASVADSFSTHRTQVLGVVLDSGDAQRYQETQQLNFPIVRFPTRREKNMYRIRSVPLVLLLDSDGMAIYSRVGALSERSAIDSVIAAIHWQRPSLATPSQPSRKKPIGT